MRIGRILRRTVAPLAAGALVATGVLAVADPAFSPLPIGSVSAQVGQAEAETLDDVIARGVGYDTDAVFQNATLGQVGEYFVVYEFGEPSIVDVASALRAFSAGAVSERDAAERYLVSHRCNAAQALAIKQQVTRPILATIIRPDEELALRLQAFLGGDPTTVPTGSRPLSPSAANALLGIDGRFHVPPLVSQVEVGTASVSVVDFDLLRARDAEVVGPLLATDGFVAEAFGGSTDLPRALADPVTLYDALLEGCMFRSAEDGTAPYEDQTLRGQPIRSVKLEDPITRPADPLNTRDLVAWVEATGVEDVALDIRVTGDFDRVADALSINPNVELTTQEFLALRANTVEPAMDVAWAIVGRNLDPLALLRQEAFAPLPGLEYGEPISGIQEAVLAGLRHDSQAVSALLLQERFQEQGGFDEQVRGAAARPVYQPGQVDANLRSRFADPTDPGRDLPTAIVQAVYWEPEFQNSDAFRSAWLRGIELASVVPVDRAGIIDQLLGVEGLFPAVAPLPEFAREHLVQQILLERLGILDAVVGVHDDVTRVHYLAPCYAVGVASQSAASARGTADVAVDAQRTERVAIFGPTAVRAPAEEEEAAEDTGERPLAGVAGTVEAQLRALFGDLTPPVEAVLADIREAASEDALRAEFREERARQDAVRAARCTLTNLRAHLGGEPVIDLDRNGIHDDLPENEVGGVQVEPAPPPPPAT